MHAAATLTRTRARGQHIREPAMFWHAFCPGRHTQPAASGSSRRPQRAALHFMPSTPCAFGSAAHLAARPRRPCPARAAAPSLSGSCRSGVARARRQAHTQAEAQASRLDLEQRLDTAGRELRAAREQGAALREQLGKLLEEAAAGRAATDGARPGRRRARVHAQQGMRAGRATLRQGRRQKAGMGLRASARAQRQTSLGHQSRRCCSPGTPFPHSPARCLCMAQAASCSRRRAACARSGARALTGRAACAARRRRAAAGRALPAPGEGGGDRGAALGAARAHAPALRPGRRAARRAGGQRAGAARRPPWRTPRQPPACLLAGTRACMLAESEGRPAARLLPWPNMGRGETLLRALNTAVSVPCGCHIRSADVAAAAVVCTLSTKQRRTKAKQTSRTEEQRAVHGISGLLAGRLRCDGA